MEKPNCLTTVSADKSLKLWSYKNGKPANVLSRDMKMVCYCISLYIFARIFFKIPSTSLIILNTLYSDIQETKPFFIMK